MAIQKGQIFLIFITLNCFMRFLNVLPLHCAQLSSYLISNRKCLRYGIVIKQSITVTINYVVEVY